MNSINIALVVEAFIAHSYRHGVLYISIHGRMLYGIHTAAIRKYII